MIRQLARESQVYISDHAKKQMASRAVSDAQVSRVLKVARYIEEPPHRNINTGDWRCNVEGQDSGDTIRIGVAIPDLAELVVITVIKVLRN